MAYFIAESNISELNLSNTRMTGKILNKLNSETKNVNIGQSKL